MRLMNTGVAIHLGRNHLMLSSQIASTMESGADSSNRSSGDLTADIKTQQANILRKIDAITRAAGVKSPRGYEIRHLQQKYNDLVDQRAGVELGPFSNPIEKLPPELWPDIIEPLLDVEYPVDVLLELTSVSRTWCNVLVSSPRLWRTIVFDDMRQDYLAKAVMGISLSGSCTLDVYLEQLRASWKEVVFFVLLETKRIQFLSMGGLRPSQAQEILAQIQEMPTLKTFQPPGEWGHDLKDIDLEMLGLKRMPSIQSLIGTSISIESRLWDHLITSCFIHTPELMGKETRERYQQLPNLRNLMILAPGSDVYLEMPIVALPFITSVRYRGHGFSRIAGWFGPRVTNLHVQSTSFASPEELATSLGHFPCLHSLILQDIDFSSWHNAQAQPTILRSIKSFDLLLATPDTALDTRDIAKKQGFLCEVLVAMVPCVEVLKIEYGTLTSVCCTYIEALASLVELELTHCDFIDYVPINARNLESLSFTAESSFLLAAIVAPALRCLHIKSQSQHRFLYDSKRIGIPSCLVSGEMVSKILTLTLLVDTPVHWEFASLSSLRELNLTHRDGGLSVISSDVLEAILMRPSDLPALESIKLSGRFCEWDILLLLLERRILYSHLRISHINTLTFTHDLPYKLLRPITTLLRGKLPDRGPDDLFSLKSTKERMCNKEMTGCYGCCFALRHCNTLLVRPLHSGGWDGRGATVRYSEQFEMVYETPSEYLTAEPALSYGLAEWLSGKLTRRRELAQAYKDFSKRFHRPDSCESYSKVTPPSVIITGHSLDGTYFQQEYEEG